MFNEIKQLLGVNLKRVIRNSKAYGFEFIVLVLMQLITIPLMIKGWGLANYGLWIFLNSVPMTLSFANIDVIQATRQELTLNYDKSLKSLNNLFSNSIVCTLINLLIFGLFYFSIFFLFHDKFRLLNNFDNINLILFTILIYLGICFTILTNNLLVLFDCAGETSKSTVTNNIFYIIQSLLIATLGFLTDNLFFAFVAFFIVNLIKFIYSAFITHMNRIKLSFQYININQIKKIFLLSKSYYLNNFSNLIYLSGFNFITGVFFTAEIVSLVHSLNTLFRWSISRILSVFLMPLNYEFANYFKNKKFHLLKKLFKTQLKLLILILLLYFVVSITFGKLVFNIWTLNSFFDFEFLLILIIAENTIYIIGNNYLFYLKSINKFYSFAKKEFLLSVLVIISLFFLGFYSYNIESFIYVLILRSVIAFIFSRQSYLNNKYLPYNKI